MQKHAPNRYYKVDNYIFIKTIGDNWIFIYNKICNQIKSIDYTPLSAIDNFKCSIRRLEHGTGRKSRKSIESVPSGPSGQSGQMGDNRGLFNEPKGSY